MVVALEFLASSPALSAWAFAEVANPMDLNNYHLIPLATLLKLPVVIKEEPSPQAIDFAIPFLLLGQF